MNNVQQAIRDAAEKGGYRYRWWKVNDLEHSEGYNGLQLRALSEHLHDPDFWKALAKARKWEDAKRGVTESLTSNFLNFGRKPAHFMRQPVRTCTRV